MDEHVKRELHRILNEVSVWRYRKKIFDECPERLFWIENVTQLLIENKRLKDELHR